MTKIEDFFARIDSNPLNVVQGGQHGAHLGIYFSDHALELISLIVHLALRLRSGAAKTILRGED